ncbi:MAG: DUF1553 domain-containing protein [Fuerstiella sp.]
MFAFSVSAGDSFFETEVKPLLESKCLSCHSDNIRKGQFSLTTSKDVIDNGYLNSQDPDASHLLQLVIPSGEDPAEMPKQGAKLTAKEVEILRTWISTGSEWPEDMPLAEQSKADSSWWSLQPLKPVGIPQWPDSVVRPVPVPNPIDHFLANKLGNKQLQFNSKATRQVLIRRAYYDLIGLPPSPADIERFTKDDDPHAWSTLIDQLLDSDQYGERWGRHWLDVVRFGESNGFERNVIINELWPFRDYVIESINNDKPFDEFIKEHIAGDVLAPGDPTIEVGSAFLVAGPYDNVGNQDAAQQAQIRANTIDEMVRSTSEAFLGITVGCARCHDHKFDPILQADYYSMYATFAGVRHGVKEVATTQQRDERNRRLKPLQAKRSVLDRQRRLLAEAIQTRANSQATSIESQWTRPAANRSKTEDSFPNVSAKLVRFISEGQDSNLQDTKNFRIDEFQIWSADHPDKNVALSSNGAIARGSSRQISDYPGAYGPELTIDGKTGERFIGNAGQLTIEFAKPETINRVVFSSARNEPNPALRLFTFVSDYRIEASLDGQTWQVISSSKNRQPINEQHKQLRLKRIVTTEEERTQKRVLDRQISAIDRQLKTIPALPRIWVGSRDKSAASGPFHLFVGGNPQRLGKPVAVASLSILKGQQEPVPISYELPQSASESQRRLQLANWIANDNNPLTSRVLANRIWHYHFGTGIVSTPSDFGYMGTLPSHPDLLDWLANRLIQNEWRIKDLHRTIMRSSAYQQSSTQRAEAMQVDADSRLLWRFPMRRLSAEEIRDSMLSVAGVLNEKMGGPGFRLYEYLQDNVATYVPRNQHTPETYRRAVYHQNARAAVVDLMTEFDQPDCAFGAPRRSSTTTPLQALTALNHSFTQDMAVALARRLEDQHPNQVKRQVQFAFQLCFGRHATAEELKSCEAHSNKYNLASLCRVMLNTSEMIYLK